MKTSVALSVALGTLLISAPATAATIFMQTPAIENMSTSDVQAGYLTANDFRLDASEVVRSVTWKGARTEVLARDAFVINFYTDPLSSTPWQSFAVGAAVDRVPTGEFIVNFPAFSYTADLGAGIALNAGTTYWISIASNTPGAEDPWVWATGEGTLAATFIIRDDTWNSSAFEPYFILDNANVGAASVPEPGTLLLVGTGVIALARRRCHRRSHVCPTRSML
jgi:hypothetical protein